MQLDQTVAVVSMIAACYTGLAKEGFSGVGSLAVPIITWVTPARQAVVILLPILIFQDLVSPYIYRKDWDGPSLFSILPGMTLGVALGYYFAANVSGGAVLALVGAIALASSLQWFLRRQKPEAQPSGAIAGALLGAVSGLSSQIANSGPLPFQVWIRNRGLNMKVLAGTSAVAFAYMNGIKVPAYLALGQLDRSSNVASAYLTPIAIVAAILGAKAIKRISLDTVQRFCAPNLTGLRSKVVRRAD